MKPIHLAAGSAAGALAMAAALPARPRAIANFRPRADVSDPKAMIEQLQKAFNAFKEENDKALAAGGRVDVLMSGKVDSINADLTKLQDAINEMNVRVAASSLGGGGVKGTTPEKKAYADAFDVFFRQGRGGDELKALAVKAQITRQSDPDGGYVVSPEIEQTIDRVLGTVSMMRQLASVRTTGASVYKKRVGQGGSTSGWVGEGETRNETNTPKLSELEFPAMTIYAEPSATEEMLEDADFDVASWLADEVNIEFAEQEGAGFISGNGVKRPRGVLAYDTVEDGTWTWGKLGYKVSGDATQLTSADALIDLTSALKQGFRMNAAWMMNRFTTGTIRKLKNGEGEYIWQPSLAIDKPPTLLGYPTYDDDNMPDVGAGAFPVAFGDFKRGYLILDRRGVRILRNPYKSPGFVDFYTTKRVGGGVQQFQAIKLLKISA